MDIETWNKIIRTVKLALWPNKIVRAVKLVLWWTLSICKPARIGEEELEDEATKANNFRPYVHTIPTITVVGMVSTDLHVDIASVREIFTG